MKLKTAVDRDIKIFQGTTNALFAWQKNKIAKLIETYRQNVVRIIAYHLSNMPVIDFTTYLQLRTDKIIEQEIESQTKVLQAAIYPAWEKLRKEQNLAGRLFAGYIARKTQPPWMPVNLDLASPIPERNAHDRWQSEIPYRLKHLEQEVLKAVQQGVHQDGTVHKIMQRVGLVFNSHIRIAREADWRPKIYRDAEAINEKYDQDSWEVSSMLGGGANVTEGFFTMDDVNALFDEQNKAMKWYYREYNPAMDDAIWARNVALMSMEQDLMRDAIHRLHEGQLTIGSENMGIDDFQWVTRKPQKECDECCQRDGMTMAEIKAEFGTGSFPRNAHVWPPELKQDSPPALHPHCACQLVPKIKDDWGTEQLEKSGFTWDDLSGEFFNPSAQEAKYGFTRMSYDDWISNIGEPNAAQKRAF